MRKGSRRGSVCWRWREESESCESAVRRAFGGFEGDGGRAVGGAAGGGGRRLMRGAGGVIEREVCESESESESEPEGSGSGSGSESESSIRNGLAGGRGMSNFLAALIASLLDSSINNGTQEE
jgi:hypothetical protein